MKIEFTLNYHGGDGYRDAGKEEDVADEYGEALISLGYAKPVASEPKAKQDQPKARTKQDQPETETK